MLKFFEIGWPWDSMMATTIAIATAIIAIPSNLLFKSNGLTDFLDINMPYRRNRGWIFRYV